MNALRVRGGAVLTAYGIGKEPLARALRENTKLRTQTLADSSIVDKAKFPGLLAYDVPDFTPEATLGDKGLRTLDRLTKLLVVTARYALADAGLKDGGTFVGVQPEDIGICTSNAYGSLEAIHEIDRVATLEDPRYINPAKFPNTVSNTASGYVSIWEDLRAFNVTVSNGNPGGLDAFYVAAVHASQHRARHVLVGGGEALSDALCVAWHRLGLGTKEPNVAPLAEACAYIALEQIAASEAKIAKGVFVTGHGAAFDPKATSSLLVASSDAMERATRFAIADAGLSPQDIDLVITGACGIEEYDRAQREGVRAVTYAPNFDLKHIAGECLGGAGSLAAWVAAAALAGEVSLPVSAGGLANTLRTVLITELGFNGNASAIVLVRR